VRRMRRTWLTRPQVAHPPHRGPARLPGWVGR
jgi:hypothetical protein